ncbi:MAG TPA: DNA-directed RNA polymerase subunit omega [Nitrospinaceae bacterium]|jgi:DNA-directed RNA polymerase subunit K/omega|nr:DNA-directed RNA polymerase subunit omega [Nitrospinaceae bacterium]
MTLLAMNISELIQKAMNVVKSRYLLCILISQRIHQLEKGAPPAIDVDPDEYTSPKTFLKLSLMEIIEGNMDIEKPESKSA